MAWSGRYGQVRHPRWGVIVAIFSTRKIKEGEELLCNYGYSPGMKTKQSSQCETPTFTLNLYVDFETST